MSWPKRELPWCLISSSLLPVKGESKAYYVGLALHFPGACPTHYVFYHINPCEMESGCGCYGRMKTMSGSRRLKWPDYFQALSVLGLGWWQSLGNHGQQFR